MAKRKYIDEIELEERFREFLDDVYGEVKVLDDLYYPTSDVLEAVDPHSFLHYLTEYAYDLIEKGYIIEGYNDEDYNPNDEEDDEDDDDEDEDED